MHPYEQDAAEKSLTNKINNVPLYSFSFLDISLDICSCLLYDSLMYWSFAWM